MYALNIITGMCFRVRLYRAINWKFWERREPECYFIRQKNHEYLPAFNLYKAQIDFKILIKQLEKQNRPEVKVAG